MWVLCFNFSSSVCQSLAETSAVQLFSLRCRFEVASLVRSSPSSHLALDSARQRVYWLAACSPPGTVVACQLQTQCAETNKKERRKLTKKEREAQWRFFRAAQRKTRKMTRASRGGGHEQTVKERACCDKRPFLWYGHSSAAFTEGNIPRREKENRKRFKTFTQGRNR